MHVALPQESVLAKTTELLSQSPPPTIRPVLALGAPCRHHHLPSSLTSPKPVSNPSVGEHVCAHRPPGRDPLLLQDLPCWKRRTPACQNLLCTAGHSCPRNAGCAVSAQHWTWLAIYWCTLWKGVTRKYYSLNKNHCGTLPKQPVTQLV